MRSSHHALTKHFSNKNTEPKSSELSYTIGLKCIVGLNYIIRLKYITRLEYLWAILLEDEPQCFASAVYSVSDTDGMWKYNFDVSRERCSLKVRLTFLSLANLRGFLFFHYQQLCLSNLRIFLCIQELRHICSISSTTSNCDVSKVEISKFFMLIGFFISSTLLSFRRQQVCLFGEGSDHGKKFPKFSQRKFQLKHLNVACEYLEGRKEQISYRLPARYH